MADSKTTNTGNNFYKIGQQMGPEKLDTGTADILTGIGKQLRTHGSAMAAERKAKAKKLKEERNAAGDKISQAFVDMGETLSQLPQESYNQAQNEVEELRYRMYECIDSKDTKCQQDIMLQLNKVKARHAGDADNLTTLVETWQADENGNRPVSTDAMSKDDVAIMENFVGNKSKRVVYADDGTMMYEWDVPVLDKNEFLEDGTTPNPNFGEPLIDPVTGQPEVEPKSYSLQDLQNRVILKDTVNGNKYLDLEQTMKETISNTGKKPTQGEMKRKVAEIIPRDEKKIKDWLHGNPAEQHDLDVESYLTDLIERDFGTFKSLGIDLNSTEYAVFDQDDPKDGVQADEVPDWFKTQLIRDVMNVKDLEISHDILTEIYAARGLNNVLGIDYREDDTVPGGFVGNKPYNTEEDKILGMDGVEVNKVDAENKRRRLEKLKSLDDPAVLEKYAGWDVVEIAEEIEVDINKGILDPVSGETITIGNYIAKAINKKAKGKTPPSGLSAEEKIQWYKDNG